MNFKRSINSQIYEGFIPEYCLIDIGAANGFISKEWEILQENITLVMFEPDHRSYRELVDQGNQKHKVLNSAL